MAADAPGPPDDAERRRLTVRALARVEGEGRLDVTVRSGAVEHARLDIYEPPGSSRLFFVAATSGSHPTSRRGSAESARSRIR